jgi:predicted nucleic acid-binding protein
MILVDTNVLLRAAQPAHVHYAAAKAAVKTSRRRGYIPCIVPQVLYEYWVVATRPIAENGLGLTPAETEHDLGQIVDQFHLFRDERAILDRWLRLVVVHSVQGKSAHDARLVAAMIRHGITHLVTFNDQHFRRFTAITAIHPDNVTSLPSR